MSVGRATEGLRLPDSLQRQLGAYRRRVWTIKVFEGLCAAVFGVLVGFLALFVLDRLTNTPAAVRAALFAAACLGGMLVPWALYRWVYRNRRLDQLARLLTRKHAHIGDQLLGVIELVKDTSEQKRSRRLVEAAIEQTALDASKRDFSDSVPNPRHKLWAGLVAVPIVAAAALFAFVPTAAWNSLARFAAPWRNTPRYTFAALKPLPAKQVVPHGESFAIAAELADGTAWKPAAGSARLGRQKIVEAKLADGRYEFRFPPQIDAANLDLWIGDARHRIQIVPTLRPELAGVAAEVVLPDYLERPGATRKDARSGSVSLVKGSRATVHATAGRDLASATVDGRDAPVSGATLSSPTFLVDGPVAMEMRWKDSLGLEGREPLRFTINGRDDEAPQVAVEDLPRQRVVLDTEVLSFKVHATDDFGIKKVGLEWQGVEDPIARSQAKGEKPLSGGGPDKEALDLLGTFSAKALGIEPQPVLVRMYAEDYLPGRPRAYSPTFTFYVLNAEQHAIWLTEQLSRWHRQALEVRDREMALHETNKQLRDMSPEELDQPETRRRIESQANAERANGRRLSGLVGVGEDLVKQATRNPEFGVGHLEKWAEMLQVLKDISGNRMPSVADLLKQAAQAPSQALANKGKSPMAGQVRASSPGAPSEAKPGEKPKPGAPTVADRESQQQPPDKDAANQEASKAKAKASTLRLPVTTLAGKPGRPKPDDEEPPPADEAIEEAVEQQRDLLAEFEKIAEELNKILANLEGSTLLKRLKAASRLQYKVAGRISDQVADAFGATPSVGAKSAKVLDEMAQQEAKSSQDVSYIMDDMQAYFERRQYVRFQTVLEDMRKQDVIGALRQLGDDLRKENGVSISQAEYWSDALDRWAEDLVDPTNGGKCPGCKSRGSLPPSIILEVMQILEAEINLREETRVLHQAKAAMADAEYPTSARKLSTAQEEIAVRMGKVRDRIAELPESEELFAKEMALCEKVQEVMGEAAEILARPDTGNPAIAAETEAIELLLQSKRINPSGGGGGGANPGGGGRGTTTDSALALLGKGINAKEGREDKGVAQATGDSGPVLPEEFRAGLDEYFNRLEKPGAR